MMYEFRHGNRMRSVTVNLVATYQVCCNDFGYSETHAPRRVLTKLSKGVYNSNYDNAEHDYICRVGDKIVNPDGHTYEILERLGHGTFGQVLKCHHSGSSSHVALKIIKNKPAYFHQALVEIRSVLQELDPDDDKRIVRMLDFFVYRSGRGPGRVSLHPPSGRRPDAASRPRRKHLCIAFELLSVNLYEVLKQNSFRGVSMALIRVLTDQLLKAMRCLREASVIHCDLKPENVLLSNIHHTRIKLIDFGSACFESHTVYPYIQSRFYRSPEVLLGAVIESLILRPAASMAWTCRRVRHLLGSHVAAMTFAALAFARAKVLFMKSYALLACCFGIVPCAANAKITLLVILGCEYNITESGMLQRLLATSPSRELALIQYDVQVRGQGDGFVLHHLGHSRSRDLLRAPPPAGKESMTFAKELGVKFSASSGFLFLGLPVFPGHSEYDQVRRMVEVLGMPPSTLLDAGPGASAPLPQEPQEPQELDANAQEAPQEVHSASSSGPEDGRASAERERPVQAEVTGAEHVSEEERS
eukprot:g851.t1